MWFSKSLHSAWSKNSIGPFKATTTSIWFWPKITRVVETLVTKSMAHQTPLSSFGPSIDLMTRLRATVQAKRKKEDGYPENFRAKSSKRRNKVSSKKIAFKDAIQRVITAHVRFAWRPLKTCSALKSYWRVVSARCRWASEKVSKFSSAQRIKRTCSSFAQKAMTKMTREMIESY